LESILLGHRKQKEFVIPVAANIFAPHAETDRSQQNSKISRETFQNHCARQNSAGAIGAATPALRKKCEAKTSVRQSGAG
jgi:predicted NBD/HSP70 family sugar kinase